MDFRAVDAGDSWAEDNLVLGGIAIVKFLDAKGETGWQILTTEDDLNAMERIGMSFTLGSWTEECVTGQMYPDDDR